MQKNHIARQFNNPNSLMLILIWETFERSLQITNRKIYRKAIQLNPNFTMLIQSWKCLKDLGNLKDAERFTRKAIQLNPNLADVFNLGKS